LKLFFENCCSFWVLKRCNAALNFLIERKYLMRIFYKVIGATSLLFLHAGLANAGAFPALPWKLLRVGSMYTIIIPEDVWGLLIAAERLAVRPINLIVAHGIWKARRLSDGVQR
jgi:hypothetical protein